MNNLELAGRIVMLIDAIQDRSEPPPEELTKLVVQCRNRYSELKKQFDFTTSARIARTEAIAALLEEHHEPA